MPTGKIAYHKIYGNIYYNVIRGIVSIPDIFIVEPTPPTTPPAGYCAEALSYFARMDVQPSLALKTLLNDTIVAMKDNGIWDELDQFVFMNLHTAQASTLDVKGNINHTWVNNPTWNAGFGVTLNGTSNYINSNFSPKNNGVKYTLNNASIIFNESINTAYGMEGSCENDKTATNIIGFAYLNAYNWLNGAYVYTSNFVFNYTSGFNIVSRDLINDVIVRSNAIETSNDTTSYQLSTKKYLIGACDFISGIDYYCNNLYKQYGFGSSMTLTKRQAFETILNNFNNNVQTL
jgi:hypothetical protein